MVVVDHLQVEGMPLAAALVVILAVEVPLLVITNLTMVMIDTSYTYDIVSIMNHDTYMMIMMIWR